LHVVVFSLLTALIESLHVTQEICPKESLIKTAFELQSHIPLACQSRSFIEQMQTDMLKRPFAFTEELQATQTLLFTNA